MQRRGESDTSFCLGSAVANDEALSSVPVLRFLSIYAKSPSNAFLDLVALVSSETKCEAIFTILPNTSLAEFRVGVYEPSDMRITTRPVLLEDVHELLRLEDLVFDDNVLDRALFPRQRNGQIHPSITSGNMEKWQAAVEESIASESGAEKTIFTRVAVDLDAISEDEILCRRRRRRDCRRKGKIVGFMIFKKRDNEEANDDDEFSDIAKSKKEYDGIMNLDLFKDYNEKADRLRRNTMLNTKTGYWELVVIGVDPGYRRCGIASQLLKEGLAMAEAERTDIYILSSAMARGLYLGTPGLKSGGSFEVDLAGRPYVSECFVTRR